MDRLENIKTIDTIDAIDDNEINNKNKAYHYFVLHPPTSMPYLIKAFVKFIEENYNENEDKEYYYYFGKYEK